VVYTLTHVEHTHLKKCTTIQQALQIKDGFNQEYLEKLRKKFERDFMHFYPDFLKEYEYLDFFIAIKTWLKKVEDANRECIVNFDENIINTFSGKINGIFYAEDKIGEFLKGREE
jgi:DNA polymerase sigma